MVAVAAVFFGGDIMHLLYKKSALYHTSALNYQLVFSCLMISFPSWCLMYVYSTLLTANGSLKTLNKIALAGVIINLSLNFYLIPHYKAIGGAITSFITQTALALTFMVYASRIIKLPLNVKWMMAHIGYLLLIIVLGYASVSLLRSSNWTIQLVSFGAICVVLMFVFRFISVHSIRQLVSRRLPEE